VRVQILTAAVMKMTVFWGIASCSLVEIDRRFRDAYCLNHPDLLIALMMEAASTSETSVIFCGTTRCNFPEDRQLYKWMCLDLIIVYQLCSWLKFLL
jgi:hypothetical protein